MMSEEARILIIIGFSVMIFLIISFARYWVVREQEHKYIYRISYLPKEDCWEAKNNNNPDSIPIARGETLKEVEQALREYIKRKNTKCDYYYDGNGVRDGTSEYPR